MTPPPVDDLDYEWVQLRAGKRSVTPVEGDAVPLGGLIVRPRGAVSASTLFLFLHPPAALQLLPVEIEAAKAGLHVLCAATRFSRNESLAVFEETLLDIGAYIHAAKTQWGYAKVVLLGWSSGGTLAMFYQSQAERPTLTHTPAGTPLDLARAGLIPADAVIYHGAHASRARLLGGAIDPSVRDEANPEDRDPALDLYAGDPARMPPFSPDFLKDYRAAQLARLRRITARVKDQLAALRRQGGDEADRAFLVHRTMADPHFLDPAIDPNSRRANWCWMGAPAQINAGPAGFARVATLHSWLSQWSPDDTNADAELAARSVTAPLLCLENGADDAVPPAQMRAVFAAARSVDKTYHLLEGATHFNIGQPEHVRAASLLTRDWLSARGLL